MMFEVDLHNDILVEAEDEDDLMKKLTKIPSSKLWQGYHRVTKEDAKKIIEGKRIFLK